MADRPAAVVLGSAFADGDGLGPLTPLRIDTAEGPVILHRHEETGGVVLFRHGRPHRWLPHQIPWRAHARALGALDVRALLLTSSVGVLDETVPCFVPHLAGDLFQPDNRLPDGSPCTLWPTPAPDHAHLVVDGGLFDPALGDWLTAACDLPARRLRFAHVPGPRTKTALENAVLRGMGLEVNSMSVGPEVILANELGIPTAALLVGHKASGDGGPGDAAITASLDASRAATVACVRTFLARAPTVPFGNRLYRFPAPAAP